MLLHELCCQKLFETSLDIQSRKTYLTLHKGACHFRQYVAKNNPKLVFAIFMPEIKVPVDVLILVKLYRCGLKKLRSISQIEILVDAFEIWE